MKISKVRSFSLYITIGLSLFLLLYRFSYTEPKSEMPLKVTTWDALGYYMYLPSVFIYHDISQLAWFPEIDKKYNVSGGRLYQANILKNGNRVNKYLGGVAIMELPFFFLAHALAEPLGFPADGFSTPYQYAIAFGAIFYCILALFLLRRILLRFYSDMVVAITLLLMVLATNLVQYISVDSAQSHSFIFPLYVLILYLTIKWHEKPRIIWAAAIGAVIGLATISRPTEAIMLFIPLMWNTQTKEIAKEKWQMVKENSYHIVFVVLFAFLAALPQLFYWKAATGAWVYNVGSKWDFLLPHFQVLFGFNKGWFIYTPVNLFFMIGMFFIKGFPFRKSVIIFCLLNIYIIISWHDYRYGGGYSTRALVQSYPVFALAFAAFINRIYLLKWKILFALAGGYMIFVNLFQLWQYNHWILHYYDMNRKVYSQIYLKKHITPLQASLFDNNDWLRNESKYRQKNIYTIDNHSVSIIGTDSVKIVDLNLDSLVNKNKRENWLKIEASIFTSEGINSGYILSELKYGHTTKTNKQRLKNEIAEEGRLNHYAFFVRVPEYFAQGRIRLFLVAKPVFKGMVEQLKITMKSTEYRRNSISP